MFNTLWQQKEHTNLQKLKEKELNTKYMDKMEEGCRIFAKDTPYLTYADLQKTDGIVESGRQFTWSVFNNTYNLNIAPLRNPGSPDFHAFSTSLFHSSFALTVLPVIFAATITELLGARLMLLGLGLTTLFVYIVSEYHIVRKQIITT